MAKSVSVETLAREANRDPDDILILLWDAGFDELDSSSDSIRAKHVPMVRSLLNLQSPQIYTRVSYWMEHLGKSREEFTDLLQEMDIVLSANARKLPKGALRKLRRRFPTSDMTSAIGSPQRARVTVPSSITAPCPPFRWYTIGQEQDILYLSESDILRVHDKLVDDFANFDDPIVPPGLSSSDLLSSAVSRPRAAFEGYSKYPTVEMAGAALLYSLVLNHPFYNGNKRTGLVSLLVFLDRNSFMPSCSQDDLFKLTLCVAQRRLVPRYCDNLVDREVLTIAKWIRKYSRRISKKTRPLSWLKLKRLLRYFDCDIVPAGRVGNQLNISRVVTRESWHGRSRTVKLHAKKVIFRGDGSDVDPIMIARIRSKLHLNEEHGIDSTAFYHAEPEPDEFIQQYRKLLWRLARL